MIEAPALSSREEVRHAAALIIGSELLSGKIRDENVQVLARVLRKLGIELTRVVLCPDNPQIIVRDLRELSEAHDVVFTSGGVGPTHDDVTMNAVAESLGVSSICSNEIVQILENFYGKPLTETHLLMAQIPEGAELRISEEIPWPAVVAGNIWVLPGIPQVFKKTLAAVQGHLKGPYQFFCKDILFDIEESQLKPLIDILVAKYPQVEIGSYPEVSDSKHQTRLTFDAQTESDVVGALAHARELIGNGLSSGDRENAVRSR